jgi:eukaryotic-like serine/threonine-protein kinase
VGYSEAVTSPPVEMLSGTRIGAYLVEGKLGKGGMGDVYRAVDQRTGRTVALKVLGEARAQNEALLARFEREWRVLRDVVHPNVVTLLDWPHDHRKTTYFVMELLEGQTLDARLEGGIALERPVFFETMGQIGDGLVAVHAAGIVHRDVKPENIFLCGDSPTVAKLLDFGLARIQKSQITGAGTLVGTPSYVAPEQITGDAVDARADIYSFGLVMYRALTGHHPFANEDQVTTLGHQLLSPPPPPSWLREEITPQLEALILRMLRKKPEDRPRSMGEVVATLHLLAHGDIDDDDGARASNPPDDRYGPLNPLAESLVKRTLVRKGFKPE